MKTYAGENTLAAFASIIKSAISAALSGAGGGVPSGCIMIWHGTVETVPDGWSVCDGTNGTPDLRDKFVLCSGPTYAVGATGGEAEHKLTKNEMPRHHHVQQLPPSNNSTSYNGDARRWALYAQTGSNQNQGARLTSGISAYNTSGVYLAVSTEDVGSDIAHNNMPPYYALLYIQKL